MVHKEADSIQIYQGGFRCHTAQAEHHAVPRSTSLQTLLFLVEIGFCGTTNPHLITLSSRTNYVNWESDTSIQAALLLSPSL